MEFKRYLFLILILLINIVNVISQQCTTNLECKDSGCCHKGECSKSSKCKKRNKFCYGFVGLGAFIITAIIIIHFTRKISETKKHLDLLRKTDPGSLSRNEKYRLSQKPKEIVPTNN